MTGANPHIAQLKADLRSRAAAARRDACARLGAEAAGHLLAACAEALGVTAGTVVAGYWPVGDEIDPRPLMARLAALGCRLALPLVAARDQPLEFYAWAEGDPLEPGPFGTSHPVVGAQRLHPSLLLVPLLAFDRDGFRLGYGGGYYDRTLDLLTRTPQLDLSGGVKAIGLAYAAQEVRSVPHDRHDHPLDAVATEAGLITVERR